MTNPKLALIPSGYKSGKVYSILPNNASGDFDFTRQSIGTRVRKDGLIEEAKTVGSITNLQIRSEEFDNSAWIKSDISVTANDTLAPNGTNTADAIVEGTGTGGKIIYDTHTTTTGIYTFSVHIKKEDKTYTAIQVSGSTTTSMFNVDLDNGTGQVVAGSFDETNIETLANDWYRVSVTFTATSGTLNNQIYLMNGSAYANRNYTGNGTDKNYVWGAMLNEGALSDYIKTEGTTETKTVETFTDVPRLDWLNSNCPSLLLEPSRTNFITYSSDFSSLNIRNNAVVTSNAIISPSGMLDADEITFDGTAYGRVEQTISATVGQSYTISLYLKNKDLSDKTQVWLGFSQTAQGNYVTITDEWQRYDITTTADGTNEYPRIQFGGTGSLYAWGFQVEQGDYPTSLIKTEGSTVTRLADVCNNAGNSDLFNDAEGVLYAEISALANDDTSGRWISLSNGTTNERISIAFQSDDIRLYIKNTSGLIWDYTYTSANIFNYNKIGLKYKSGDYALWINGTEISTDSNSNLPSGLNSLQFDSGGGISNFYGNVKDVRYFDRALTDAELTELTT